MFTFLFFRLIMLFNYIWKLFSFDLLWSATVMVSLGGAAIFTEMLQSISICKQVLPLCLTFVATGFIVFCHHNWVYSVKKMSVGGAVIIIKLKICHIILLASKSTIFFKSLVV